MADEKHTHKTEEKKTDSHSHAHADARHTHADGTAHTAEHKHEDHAHTDAKHDHAHEHKHDEKKTEVKEVKIKKDEKPKVKKELAMVNPQGLHMSRRHGSYICSFIKGKKIDVAIADLEKVIKLKVAIPFKGEIPHRKGKGMMSGRYPVRAAGLMITVLKSLKGNSVVNGLDLDKTVITEASSNWASRPMKTGSRRAKRTHIILIAKEMAPEVKK